MPNIPFGTAVPQPAHAPEAETHMAAAVVVDRPQQGSDWARRYPPLLSVAIALVIAIAVLPSALNLPQSNPSTTLEFAPVPPEDDAPPPPPGSNLGELGLGSTSGLEQGGAPGGNDTPLPTGGNGSSVRPSRP